MPEIAIQTDRAELDALERGFKLEALKFFEGKVPKLSDGTMAWLETNLKPASNSNKTEEKPEDNRTSTRKRGLEFAFPETKTEPMVLDPEWVQKNGERASAELHVLRYGEKGVKRRRRLEMMGYYS
ncbi:hypothetical protein FB45DRAFT_1032121 [Roridomyces roridus]|uniref:Uncharacterized protein n=1 Tax=Roridomyces roridus TaxID=1738132 RepID=A0AAD7FJI8_9AGAR|nr:hypothetical protein FB45DRAFT_1032106 [Roridomyces roridus]KAJ7622453.1 hypothetical protein FB45DRAFT_1032121 [Roridomyces roridus]